MVGLLLLATTACGVTAQKMGMRAGAGAAQAVGEKAQHLEPTEAGPAFERAGRGVAKGVVSQLNDPAQLAELQIVAQEAAAAAVRGIISAEGQVPDGMIASISDEAARGATLAVLRELGPDGNGPLARSLSATAERITASAMRGFEQEARLFPECVGEDRERCIDARLEGLSRAATRGVRDGLRGLIALPALLLSFLLGAGAAVVLASAVSHRYASHHHHG